MTVIRDIKIGYVGGLALLMAGCGTSDAQQPAKPPFVKTVVVDGQRDEVLRYTGVVRSRVESDLGFRVGGKIAQRLVDPGQRVQKGQVLMRLDASDLALATEGAAARVRAAEAEAERAQADEARLRPLVEAGATSASAYDAARAAVRSAVANLAAATASMREASNQRSYSSLVADADGVVVDILAEPGQVVSAGTPVVRLARSKAREASIAVPESRVEDLPTVGQAVLYGSGSRTGARLRQVSGAADPMTRTFDARYVLEGVEPPLGATVTIELPRHGAASLSVPLAALHDPGSGPGVWVVRAGRVTFRRVRVVSLGDEAASVAPGSLVPGERVVALGAQLLREGQAVRASDDGKMRS